MAGNQAKLSYRVTMEGTLVFQRVRDTKVPALGARASSPRKAT